MNAGFWLQVEELLGQALLLEGAGRSDFMAAIADHTVRVEVESLLHAEAAPDVRFESVIGDAAETFSAQRVEAGFSKRFQILRQAGHGGMGRVFEAIDRERSLRVALKSLTKLSPMHLYSFKQEFRSLAGVVHHNLVTLYELFQEGDEFYLSMEFIEGVGFLDYVRQPVSNPERLRSVLRQVTSGLTAIHAAGKLHRDLKPSNLMVDHNGRAVILDFGLVTEVEREHFGVQTEMLMGGTPGYLPPEQATGILSPAGDWYSLGVILFEALTGELPFASTHAEVANLPDGCPEDLAQVCQALLCSDPGARPDGAEVMKLLGGGTAIVPLTQPALFVDREEPLSQIEDAFSVLCAGQTAVVMLSGGAGSGKTALVERFLQNASRRAGVLVLTGRCYEQETLPYKGIDSLIDQLSRLLSTPSFVWSKAMMPHDAAALSAVFPVLDSVPLFAEARRGSSTLTDRVELRRRAFLALREMLGSIGRQARLILWLDDLQWGDQESAKLLSEVLRCPDSPHLLLVCSYRSEGTEAVDSALHELLETLEREPVMKIGIALEPLSTGDAALLAQSMLRGTGEASDERALAIANDSGGVPFFIRELARAASAYTGAKLPLESLIWIRVTELDPEPRRLMHLIAIAGRPITQMSVFAAAGIESRSPAILNVLTNAGLLCSRGPASSDTLEPFHDRIREAIVARIDESQKRTLHQQLAEALERDPHADVELMAAHFEAGGELRRAGAYYQQAADRAAASVAFNRAAELYGRTLRLRELAPAERADVELKLAEALANAGRSADASHHYLAAAEHLPAPERLYNEGLAVYHLCVGGYLDEGCELINKLLIKIGRRPLQPGLQTIAAMLWLDLRCRYRGTRQPARRPEDVDAILLAQIDLLWFAAAGLGVSDLVGGFRLLLLSMELAQKAREPVRMIRAYAWHAALQVGRRSGSKQIDRTFERCRELSRSVGEPAPSRATLALTTAVRHYLLGSWAEGLPACLQAERIIVEECRGFNWELAFTRGLKLTLLMNKGEVNGLEDEARAMADDALSRGDLATATLIASLALPYSQIVADKPALARTTWQHWRDRWPSHQVKSNQEPYAVLINVWSHLYEDNVEAAFEILQQRWKSAIASSHNLRLPVASVYFWETRARVFLLMASKCQGERRGKLIQEAKKIVARLRRCPAVHAPAHAYQIDGLLYALDGDSKQALASWARALSHFERCNMQIHACAMRRVMGQWAGGAQGEEWIAEADTAMREQRIPNPRAVARLHVGELGGYFAEERSEPTPTVSPVPF